MSADGQAANAVEQAWVEELVVDRFRAGEDSANQRVDRRVHVRHAFVDIVAASVAVVGVLGVGRCDQIGCEPEAGHAGHPLGTVGSEPLGRAGSLEYEVANCAGVAHGDRQALADDRVVVPSGVTDQHGAVHVRFGAPGVVAGKGGAGTGGGRRDDPLAPRVARHGARLEEADGTIWSGEAVLPGRPGAHVRSRPAFALVEEQEEPVVLADQDVVVVGHPAEAVEQQPGDVARLRLTLQCDAERPAGHRSPSVRADDQRRAQLGGHRVDGVVHRRRRGSGDADV